MKAGLDRIKKRLNPRKVWKPRHPLALLGYYTSPVKKVVKRWKKVVGENLFDENIESLMIACGHSVSPLEPSKRFALEVALAVENVGQSWHGRINNKALGLMLKQYTTPLLSSVCELDPDLDQKFRTHRLFILELLLAVDKVLTPDNLPGWILKYGFSGDGRDYDERGLPMLRPWPKIAKLIKAATVTQSQPNGLTITPDAIRAEAKRMKLTV